MTLGQISKRVEFTTAILVLAVVSLAYRSRGADLAALSHLPAVQVDHLRMQAGAKHDAQALAQLRLAAGEGNIDAQRAAASVLLNHNDASSINDGLQFAQQAAQSGDTESPFLLGKTYFDGIASASRLPDFGKARHWFAIAADRHHPKAAYFLGLIHKSGYGVSVDPGVAAKWFKQAAQMGNADAMFMLGNAYLAGEGVAVSQPDALRWYQAAAALEHPLAAQTLAYAFHDGTLGLVKNERESKLMLMEVTHSLSHPNPS